MTKIYRAYVGYGRNPIADSTMVEMGKQNRLKSKCKPVSKLYVRPQNGSVCKHYSKFFIQQLMEQGLTLEEACEYLK